VPREARQPEPKWLKAYPTYYVTHKKTEIQYFSIVFQCKLEDCIFRGFEQLSSASGGQVACTSLEGENNLALKVLNVYLTFSSLYLSTLHVLHDFHYCPHYDYHFNKEY